jgi:hypothetical protein
MAETLALVALLLGGGVFLFVVSIRIGVTLGKRMDRALEARAAAGEDGSAQEVRRHE